MADQAQKTTNPNLPDYQEVRRIRNRLSLVLEDNDFMGKFSSKIIFRLASYVKPHWKLGITSMLAMLLYIATQVSIPVLVGITINDYLRPEDLSSAEKTAGVNRIGLTFILIVFINLFGNYFHLRGLASIHMAILLKLRTEMHAHCQKLSSMFYDHNEVGRLMSRVQNDTAALQEFSNVFVVGFAEILSLFGIIFIMLLWNLELALICFAIIPVFMLIMLFWQKRAREAFILIRHAIAGVNANLNENITGIRVTQSMNRETINMERFEELNRSHLSAHLKAIRLTASLMPSVEILTAIAFGTVIVVGGRMEQSGSLELGTMVAFALFVQRFFEPIRALVMQYAQMQRAMVAGMRIFELLDVQPEIIDSPTAKTLPPIKGLLNFNQVSFAYLPDVPVLDNLTLEVLPGKTLAIVGPTGAGKSTIVSLVARFYEVTSGSVTVDGYNVKHITHESLAKQMSMVLQEPFLYSTSVAENIRFAKTSVTQSAIETATKALGAHEFIMNLPNGYETVLLERGSNLSVGERQLISFARALVADPKILILDEATANVDSHTEQLIQNALKTLLEGRTAVIIAHRLSTIKDADQILVLKQGKIEEIGKHDELLRQNGLYAKLYEMNFRDNA